MFICQGGLNMQNSKKYLEIVYRDFPDENVVSLFTFNGDVYCVISDGPMDDNNLAVAGLIFKRNEFMFYPSFWKNMIQDKFFRRAYENGRLNN